MIDGNISMEEDTELRDLVVQTLENNGVLAKVRAELRASVFLALEEQESVMNPEPLLNKTVKQYLSNSEGKLLFSLVREFLEYFGLDYTISVYDPETYFGKEYNYIGRNKLCEELGINSTEPLLGEILKYGMNGAFNNARKNENAEEKNNKDESSVKFVNTTFEISVPKVLHTESVSSSNDNDSSDKAESLSIESPKIPINVTITDKKDKDRIYEDVSPSKSSENIGEMENKEQTEEEYDKGNNNNNNNISDKISTSLNDENVARMEETVDSSIQGNVLNETESLIKFDQSLVTEIKTNQNEDISKENSINNLESHRLKNVENKKPINVDSGFGKTVYFDQIIVDGKLKDVKNVTCKEESILDLPPVDCKANSIFADLPPLNGKKTNINDLKELMDIGLASDGVDNYEEDFVSSASGSTNELSPFKDPIKMESPVLLQTKKEDKIHSARSEDISEEIEEVDEVLSSTSCLEDVHTDRNASNFPTGI